MPPGISGSQLRGRATRVPGFFEPSRRLQAGDEIDRVAAVHVVGDDVAAWPKPDRVVGLDEVEVRSVERNGGAPTQISGEARCAFLEECRASYRADAVGSDHQIRLDVAPVGETGNRGIALVAEGHAALTKLHRRRRQLLAQNP